MNEFNQILVPQEVDPWRLQQLHDPLTSVPFRSINDQLKLDGTQSFSRASVGYYLDHATGLITSAAVDTPRFERMPTGLVGVLLEGASTNLILQSEDLGTTWLNTWSNGTTLTLNDTTAPDGNITADKIEQSVAAGDGIYQQVTLALSTVHAFSLYVKNEDATQSRFTEFTTGFYVIITWTAGVPSISSSSGFTTTIESVGSGWYRIKSVFTSHASTATHKFVLFPQEGTGVGNGIWVWGSQVEELPFASSYIPTTTTAVTRATDSLQITSANNTVKYGNPRTRILEFDYAGIVDGFDTILNGPTSLDQFIFGVSSDRFRAQVSVDSGTYIDLTSPSAEFVPNTVYRVGITFDGTTLKLWVNGTNTASSSTTGSTSIVDHTYVTLLNGNLARPVFGHTRRYLEYDRAMSDAEMARMTDPAKEI